jgi:hypothetical protein
MKVFEITISKVVYRLVDEFDTEDTARSYAIAKRDDYTFEDNKEEYFYELTEVSNV